MRWFRGLFALMIVVGTVTFVGCGGGAPETETSVEETQATDEAAYEDATESGEIE